MGVFYLGQSFFMWITCGKLFLNIFKINLDIPKCRHNFVLNKNGGQRSEHQKI